MRVYATLPELEVTKKGAEKTKEIYVLSLGSDLRGDSNHRPPVVGATNETLDRISSGITTAMRYFVISASNIFENIRVDQPVSLSGDGIVLYPPSDPEGMLALHLVVVESDKKTRNLGKVLGDLFGNDDVKGAMAAIRRATSGASVLPTTLLTSLFGAVTSVLPGVLRDNKDDVLFSHSHSGVDFNGYGGSHDGSSYAIGNDRVRATLRIWSRE